MKLNDKPQFAAILSRAFRTLRQPVPEAEILDVWWTKLEPFSIEAVAHAFSRHLDVSEYAPTPAAILKFLPKQRDGHREPNEAWAIALLSRDERETVVWTAQMAEAFSVARTILEGGDEVGARMAFIERYRVLVEDARAHGSPARWFASLGHDKDRRDAALSQAMTDGLLQIADVRSIAPQLCAPEDSGDPHVAADALSKLGEMVSKVKSSIERRAEVRTAELLEQQKFTQSAKRAAAERVAAYEGQSS